MEIRALNQRLVGFGGSPAWLFVRKFQEFLSVVNSSAVDEKQSEQSTHDPKYCE